MALISHDTLFSNAQDSMNDDVQVAVHKGGMR